MDSSKSSRIMMQLSRPFDEQSRRQIVQKGSFLGHGDVHGPEKFHSFSLQQNRPCRAPTLNAGVIDVLSIDSEVTVAKCCPSSQWSIIDGNWTRLQSPSPFHEFILLQVRYVVRRAQGTALSVRFRIQIRGSDGRSICTRIDRFPRLSRKTGIA